jgi:hypothetical protein
MKFWLFISEIKKSKKNKIKISNQGESCVQTTKNQTQTRLNRLHLLLSSHFCSLFTLITKHFFKIPFSSLQLQYLHPKKKERLKYTAFSHTLALSFPLSSSKRVSFAHKGICARTQEKQGVKGSKLKV